MGLNTNLLVFKNIPSNKVEEKTYEILRLLNLEIVSSKCDIDFSLKSSLIYSNQNSIAVTYFEGDLLFESSCSKFMTYTKPCIIQDMSNLRPIFHICISDTTNTSSYEIYQDGNYFDKSFGFEDIDFSFLYEDGLELEEEKESCLKKDENLESALTEFIESFDYYDILNQKISIFETIDLEDKNNL